MSSLTAEANRVIDARDIRSLFQPLVSLMTLEVVGFEALTRGPAGSLLEAPLDLLRAAGEAGRGAELDWMCAAAAYQAAVAAHLHPSVSVFLNFEAATLLTPCPEDLTSSVRKAKERLRVVIELTERSLIEDPSRLLDALVQVHDIGWSVAIANAAVGPMSLSLLPLIQPDVIKLDMRDLRDDPATIIERGARARLYAEHSGATVIAEGIERSHDVLLARTAGAEFGQGWHFGQPGPLPARILPPDKVFPLLPALSRDFGSTPFTLITARRPSAVTEKRYLNLLNHQLEQQIGSTGPGSLLLISRRLNARAAEIERARIRPLAEMAAYTVILGLPFDDLDCPRTRAAPLQHQDPLSEEWNVIVLGPHFSGAITARDLGDTGTNDEYHRFEYAVTYDRDLILTAARGLLHRVTGAPSQNHLA